MLCSTPNVAAFQLTTNNVRDAQPPVVTDAYVALIETSTVEVEDPHLPAPER